MLFEPTKAAGLGIRPSAALLQAGVVAIEHLSARAKEWMWKYAEARVRHPLLPNTKAGAAEWEREGGCGGMGAGTERGVYDGS